MRKEVSLALALVCVLFAAGCSTGSSDDTVKTADTPGTPPNTTATNADTVLTATLDTASGSAIPAQFTADVSWKIKDSEWKSDDVYVAQAYLADTSGTPYALGSPFSFSKTQSGTDKYTFSIPNAGLPASIKKPYELTIVVKKGASDFWTSPKWTFTEGKISGVYTGTLNHYVLDSSKAIIDANDYDYQVTLTQYGSMVVATDIYYLHDSKAISQTCTVVMTASTTADGKTKLTGTGTYTNASTGETKSYSGEAYVFGDSRTISCDAYWLSTDTSKTKTGYFDANLKGSASISGKVTIDLNGQTPIFDDPSQEDNCWAVVLYGFGETELEDNAGRMCLGPVESNADKTAYWFTYEIQDLPAGSYYVMFGGIDGEPGVDEKLKDHMPWSKGEAAGLTGNTELDRDAVIRWIDGKATQADKDAIAALAPIAVKDGEKLTGKNFTAKVRATDK